jgi:3-oxoacyl-[acyl-carrier-protein] synthase III
MEDHQLAQSHLLSSNKMIIMTKPRVSNISYTLGEIKGMYSQASGFASVVENGAMAKIPEMWGWGNYFATDDIFSLAQVTIKKTLDGARILSNEVDLVIFCASTLPGRDSDLKMRSAKILKSVGIDRANMIGLTLGGCATMLNSMITARDLTAAKVYKNVLVVAIEALPPERTRFANFAIYSDICVSFLVGSELGDGLEIISSTYKTAIDQILDGVDFKNPALSKECVSQTIGKAEIRLSDIKKVFSNNTFLPVKMLNEINIGFSKNQIDASNVPRVGHCFSCDSILNYCLYKELRPEKDEGYFLFFAEADGHSASVLIKEVVN